MGFRDSSLKEKGIILCEPHDSGAAGSRIDCLCKFAVAAHDNKVAADSLRRHFFH